jgi:hypothetical protein
MLRLSGKWQSKLKLSGNGKECEALRDGLLHLEHLRCLYIGKNCLHALHGVARLHALTTLDVSENQVGPGGCWMFARHVAGCRSSHETGAQDALDDVASSIRGCPWQQVTSLEGLRGHGGVTTLLAAGNKLTDLASISALATCPALVTVDLSKNRLAARECVEFVIEQLGDRQGLTLVHFSAQLESFLWDRGCA